MQNKWFEGTFIFIIQMYDNAEQVVRRNIYINTQIYDNENKWFEGTFIFITQIYDNAEQVVRRNILYLLFKLKIMQNKWFRRNILYLLFKFMIMQNR